MDSRCTYSLNYMEKMDGNRKMKTRKRECRCSIYTPSLSVVLVDRVKVEPKRWHSHLHLSFLILFDGHNHTVAFTLVGKKIPHVALKAYVSNTSWARTVRAAQCKPPTAKGNLPPTNL